MSAPALPQLDYAPPPPAARYRKWGKVVLRCGSLIVALTAAILYGPDTVRQVWYLRAQRRCMDYNIPAGQVVYANTSNDATVLLSSGYKPVASVLGRTINIASPDAQNSATMSAGFSIPPLADVGEDTIGSYAQVGNRYLRVAVANAPIRTGGFLHVRRNAQVGQDRLVAIVFLERQDPSPPPKFPFESDQAYQQRLSTSSDPGRRLEVNALVWRPATWEPGSRLQLAGLTSLVLTGLDRHDVRLFAGQVDPVNADRFTLPYMIDGQRGVIEGTLDFLDRVQLKVIEGPATSAQMEVR
jgi:hypothetical protein